MKLFSILVLMFCIGGVISKSVKKSTENVAAIAKPEKTTKDVKIEFEPKKLKHTKLKSHTSKKVQSSAIIAIEIIDPSDNTTKSKNSKRTIESALGYGIPSANSYGVTDKPKLVFYKYSQQDIPSYQSNSQQDHSQSYNQQDQSPQEYKPANNLQVQKSIRYDLGTTQHVDYSKLNVPNYQPTTLFTTYNQHGQVGGLTQNVPQGHNVPVILLRVYTNQLGGAVYPNLPTNHPYAGLNNINLQNMLNKFFDRYFNQKQNEQYQGDQSSVGYQQSYYPNHQGNYQQTGYQPQTQQYYSQPQQSEQDYYGNQPSQYHQQYQDDIQQQQYNQQSYDYDRLLTHENYPSKAHTRVVFHINKANGKGDLQQPRILPTKFNNYQQPLSYSSLVFHKQQTPQSSNYDNYEYPQYPPQDSTLTQNQDDAGYYYKPEIQQQLQNYQKQLLSYQSEQGDYNQDEQNYEEPQQNHQITQQDYRSTEDDYKSVPQDSGNLSEKQLVDTQTVSTPYNYHAHSNIAKVSQKRTARKTETTIRINSPIKQK